MKKIAILSLLSVFLFSCASKDDVVYFNGMDSTNNTIGLDSYSPTYHIDDELVIIVNALDSEAARPFNKTSVSVPITLEEGLIILRWMLKVDNELNLSGRSRWEHQFPGYRND